MPTIAGSALNAGPEAKRGSALSSNPRTQPTLEEVATLAGVSRATVSRVVNESPRASEQARAAVRRAVEQLGYVPNRAARSLVTRRTQSIGLGITEPEARFFSDPFFAGIVRGVSQVLGASDYQQVLLMAQSAPERARLERYLAGGHVDGVVLVSLHADDPLPARLEARGLPTVLIGRPPEGVRVSYVDADNRNGAREAVTHLVQQGRERVATITGPLDMSAGSDRLEGYRQALRAAGVAADDALVEHGDFTQEGGLRAARALLGRRPDLDAVFAASDLMAAGAIQALSEAGRRVPGDVAVIGFDDSVVAQSLDPPLTTVRQPMHQLGQEVARMLLDQLADPTRPTRRLVLDTSLTLRQSA